VPTTTEKYYYSQCKKNTVIREMKIEDYDGVLSHWQSDRSIYLDERDSLENINRTYVLLLYVVYF
jgi:hypothetical protein